MDLVVASSVIKAPPAVDTRSGVENFQKGYPRQESYVSTELSKTEIPEIVLDLKQTHPVSRLRIVWGDEQSTPEEWVIEVSTDGKEWKPFCSGSKKTVDYYSWWPGYEYYGF